MTRGMQAENSTNSIDSQRTELPNQSTMDSPKLDPHTKLSNTPSTAVSDGGESTTLPSPGLQVSQQNRPCYFTAAQPSQIRHTEIAQTPTRTSLRGLPALDRRATQYNVVNEEYLKENPWYGEVKKPIYSLGQPLPHTSRRREARTNGKHDLEADAARPALPTESRNVESWISPPDMTRQLGRHSHWFHENTSRFAVDAEPLGHEERPEVEKGKQDPNELRNWWARLRARYPEPLAEFLATFVSIFLAIAGSLSVMLSTDVFSVYDNFVISWAWGFAWMLGIYIGSGVSGAHMNPAISISLGVYRRFPWRQCAVYVVVQMVAATVAGALAYGVFREMIQHVDPALKISWKCFCGMPPDWMSTKGAVCIQVVQSAVTMVAVLALGDDQNDPPGAGMHAFILGLLSTTLKLTLGYNAGSALNPAADLGPRLVTLWVGYSRSLVFGNTWWLIGPWAANLAGAIIGGALYDSFIFVGSESPINRRILDDLWKKKS